MSVTIKLKRGNASDWTSQNITLASGEPGYELDTGRLKIGDGSTAWNSLSYASVIPTGILAGSGINVNLGSNGSTATISVSGLNSSYISDFNEAVDDRIGSGLFVAGTGINLSYDDAGNSFTVSVTGLIANPTNNRLLTSRDNTTTGIDAETNLTFDGSLLSVSGDLVANTGNLDVLYLNTNIEPALLQGQIAWNDTEGTADIALTDTETISIGEHIVYRVRNDTGSTLYKGQAVYASGVHANGIILPDLYTADGSIREIRFIGLIYENINDNNNGYAVNFGHIHNIDTRGNVATNYAIGDETWSDGDILYVHPTIAGKLTNVEPKHSIAIAIILDAASSGKIFVRPTSYGHLDDNHDVNVSGATDGQFLQYNSSTDYWVPSSSGNFTTLLVNGTGVSVNGHTHTTSDITDFNSSVSGLLPTISNNADNRVLTSTGTTTGINAESNLTFNGSTLTVTGLANVDNLRLDGNTLSTTNTNGDLVINPNGNGALQRDSGGNARGEYAVDWQTVRSSDTMVAGGNYSVIGGGRDNTSSGSYSTVSGGNSNLAFSARSFVGAGQSNVTAAKVRRANNITSSTSTITVLNATAADFDNTTANALQIRYRVGTAGSWTNATRTVSTATQSGSNVILVVTASVGALSPNQWTNVTVVNTAETDTNQGQVVGGGINNISSGNISTVGGGESNTASNSYCVVGGGQSNTASGSRSVVGGGGSNTASNSYCVVGGGQFNTASNSYCVVGGGRFNAASGSRSFVGGGLFNTASNSYCVVGGGLFNAASGSRSFVGGGQSNNVVSSDYSAIVAGNNNLISTDIEGTHNIIVGGSNNSIINSNYATILGGSDIVVDTRGSYSIASGKNTKTNIAGEEARAIGRFNTNGDAQRRQFIIRARILADQTNKPVLINDGFDLDIGYLVPSNTWLEIPPNTTWLFEIKLVVRSVNSVASAGYEIRGVAERSALFTLILDETTTTLYSDEPILWYPSLSIETDYDRNELRVTFEKGATDEIYVVGTVDIVQVSVPDTVPAYS